LQFIACLANTFRGGNEYQIALSILLRVLQAPCVHDINQVQELRKMIGYKSKRAMARDKLIELAKEGMGMHSPDAPEYIVCEALIEALAQPEQEPNFGPQPGMHYGMNQDDWKDIVAAISKARDSRGIYLACRPADVFQDWFLAMGLFKPKEKNT
jgi:hypothetical protein